MNRALTFFAALVACSLAAGLPAAAQTPPLQPRFDFDLSLIHISEPTRPY